jgi:hypothetical protein
MGASTNHVYSWDVHGESDNPKQSQLQSRQFRCAQSRLFACNFTWLRELCLCLSFIAQVSSSVDSLFKVNFGSNFGAPLSISYVALARWSLTNQLLATWQSSADATPGNALGMTVNIDDPTLVQSSVANGLLLPSFFQVKGNSSLYFWIDSFSPVTTDVYCIELYGNPPAFPIPPSRNSYQAVVCQNGQGILGNPFLTLTCPTLIGYQGYSYNGLVFPSLGTSPYSFSILNGQLPSGLSLVGQNTQGAITGTPLVSTSTTFTIRVRKLFVFMLSLAVSN